MRKIFVISFVMFCAFEMAFAQTDSTLYSREKTPQERAEKHTEKMVKWLALNPDQASKIKATNLEHAQKADDLRTKYKAMTDKHGMGKEFKSLEENTDSKYKSILSPSQYDKYWQMKMKKMEKKKEKRKMKKENH